MVELSDIIGLIGVVLVLVAYLLLQMQRLQPEHISYLLMNCLGSVFILISLYYKWNLSAALVEIAWFAISAFGIVKAIQGPVEKPSKNSG